MTLAPVNTFNSTTDGSFGGRIDLVPNSKVIKEHVDSLPPGYQPNFFWSINGSTFEETNLFMSIPNYATRSGVDIINFVKFGGYAGPRPDPSTDQIILDWDNNKFFWYEWTAPAFSHKFWYRVLDNSLNPLPNFEIYYVRNLSNGQDGYRAWGFQLISVSGKDLVLNTVQTNVNYKTTPSIWTNFTKIHLH